MNGGAVMVGVMRRSDGRAGQEAAPQLVLDLDPFRLCGVGCGEPLAGLAFLGVGCFGPAPGDVEYPSYGVTVEVSGGRVRGFRVHVRPTPAEVAAGIHPFAGLIRHRGVVFDPARVASKADVVARFGPPGRIADHPAGRTLAFAAGDLGWELLLSADGRLATVGVHDRE